MKKILILSGLSLLVALTVRAQDKVTEYNVRPAVAVRTPLQGDSINFTGGEFYQFNLSSCIRQQNSLTAQFVSFSLSNLANIFYPPNFYNN